MTQKSKKRKRRSGSGKKSSSGSMIGFRSGLKSFVGTSTKQKKKESPLSRVITYLLLAAAIGLLIYRLMH